MQTRSPAPRDTGQITCVSDCGYSGHLVYPTLWIWPATGIVLAFAWIALRMLWRRNASLR